MASELNVKEVTTSLTMDVNFEATDEMVMIQIQNKVESDQNVRTCGM